MSNAARNAPGRAYPQRRNLENNVRCPRCGDEMVHLGPVTVHQGSRLCTVGRDGPLQRESTTPSGRGAVVYMRFFCENGHQWHESLRFHKGIVTRTISPVTDYVVGSELPELWRD